MSCAFQELAAADEQFDMIFIDADKGNYINYYNFIMDNTLLRLRGVICVDNSLLKGKVYLKDTTDSNGLALREFNQFISNDPRVEQVCFRYFHASVRSLLFIPLLSEGCSLCLKGHCPSKRWHQSHPAPSAGLPVLARSGTVATPQISIFWQHFHPDGTHLRADLSSLGYDNGR